MDLPRSERIWLMIGGASLVVFFAIILLMALVWGFHNPGQMKTIAPDAVRTTPPFDKPGLYQVGPNEYRAVMIAQMFMYQPNNVTVPAGSTVHFEVTSPDVVHGFEIPGTNVNLMVVPGHITEYTATFRNKMDRVIVCNEYCGSGHQVMLGRFVVQ
ncbi:cytochrome C oxidase subunit II [Kyrpidia spormannii]|uniref:Cytochrome aa3 subunit 2 n=1 Tax=Kyrpidia spormannii TaxID=2055160 RepID=A0A2K8NAH9_9BACL|nr:cytochrome c oxidase subunit II [Kyrpidia spormannii]ATY86324.1 cytochrome C oxidase subunit II [Kyrpidia spormannii]HHY67059.1 cytochrome C oxidase subunit II [Alicyclobacillus sp.]